MYGKTSPTCIVCFITNLEFTGVYALYENDTDPKAVLVKWDRIKCSYSNGILCVLEGMR